MYKTIAQGAIMIATFFIIWFSVREINWMKLFRIDQVSHSTEEKLGDMLWEMYKDTEKEIHDSTITATLDSIVKHLCEANEIDPSIIKMHLIVNEEVNAYALPNHRLIVNTGLLTKTENAEELAGVIAHEVAHMELNHVMKKLVKEVGLSVLISVTTGNNAGGDVVKETAKVLSSTAYDRNIEKEADIKAVEYLQKAQIDPEHFANLLYKLSDELPEAAKYFSWISTHPDSKARSEYVIQQKSKEKVRYKTVIEKEEWESFKEKLELN